MIRLSSFTPDDFDAFISWVDSEELLLAIAGSVFTYPLTRDQLHSYLILENSHSFTIVDTDQDKKIGHAELVQSGDGRYKVDKLLIGDKSIRGKGIGEKVIKELLAYAFDRLNATIVELNVFDWNTAAIRCYEKCGFRINPGNNSQYRIKNEVWTALNMTIGREEWALQ